MYIASNFCALTQAIFKSFMYCGITYPVGDVWSDSGRQDIAAAISFMSSEIHARFIRSRQYEYHDSESIKCEKYQLNFLVKRG